MPIIHFSKTTNTNHCNTLNLYYRAYKEDTENTSSDEEDILDYVNIKPNNFENADSTFKKVQGSTFVAANRAISSCKGVMKVYQPSGKKENTLRSRLPSILKCYRSHFDAALDGTNSYQDTDLYFGTKNMVNKLREPLSYYKYKQRNKDITKAINYTSTIEKIRSKMMNRNQSELNGISSKRMLNGKIKYIGVNETIKMAKTETDSISKLVFADLKSKLRSKLRPDSNEV